jgi:hypothetical protein
MDEEISKCADIEDGAVRGEGSAGEAMAGTRHLRRSIPCMLDRRLWHLERRCKLLLLLQQIPPRSYVQFPLPLQSLGQLCPAQAVSGILVVDYGIDGFTLTLKRLAVSIFANASKSRFGEGREGSKV